MIAVDTSTFVAFNAGEKGKDIDRFAEALQAGLVVLPPTVLAEILSDPNLPAIFERHILKIPLLETRAGFWNRVGRTRKLMIKKGFKCRLADAQIAQFCIDSKLPLISRDQDFKKFGSHLGLSLVLGP